uniref:Extended synaptotagmin 1 n=1 Tax=Cyclopterus lumpus TaxID=8103 RepID=A0A8C2X7R4_CYCLU
MPPADAEPGVSRSTAAVAAPALRSQPPGERALSVLWSFAKCLGALLPVYLAGYYGFSISVVLFALMIYMGWKHSRLEKVARLKFSMFLLENERAFTTEKALRTNRDLPPWVNFPDVEKVEWLNKILQQAWPFIGQYLEKLLVETIAPAIRASSIHLQTLSFTKVNIGDKALKVVGVKAHTELDKRQVMLDLYLSYAGDVEINVEIKKYFCKAGVKGVQLHGKLRVILEPLIGDVPLVGAITMFFIRRPKLDINWTGLTNLLDIPGLNAISDTMIMDAIASHMVLPNRLTVPLVADLRVAQLRSPLPRGVVRIHLLEAEDLTAKDTVIKGLIDGKSDPYAVLRVGTQIFTSHHVDSNLNPQWREMYEVIVHEVPGQELEVEVFDKDPDQDDFLGRYVHLRLEWLSLLSSADRLSEVIQKNQNLTTKTADPPSAAILAIYLDQADALKGNKDPSPMAQISIQDATKESKTCYGTNSPVWEDAFTFFIQDPCKQDIDIQVKDDDRALSLGSLSISLNRLLEIPELTMDQWFQLENSGSASRIYVKIVLRVGASHRDFFPGGITSELNPMGPGGLAKPLPTRPQHTTPDPEFATEGVLRIHLVEAQNLIAKDNFMGGMVKGKSDPYVKIRVAGITFRSHTIKENLNPIWNELYEVILTQLPGQEIQFELFDKDIDQDDFLGRCVLTLQIKLEHFSPHVFAYVCLQLSHSWGQALGSFTLPLREVLFEPGLVLDRWSWTLSWRCVEGLQGKQVTTAEERKPFPDGCLPISTSDREVDSPCESNIPSSMPHCSHCLHCKHCSYQGFPFYLFIYNIERHLYVKQSHFLCCVFRNDNANSTGQVKLTIGYSIEESRLFITIHSCRALAACSKDGADPYVSFILLPDKKATTKRRTATKKRDLNPEFNERFDFDFSLEESTQRRLDLSVKNSVSFMSRERELIGKLQLDLDQIDLKTGITQCYDLMRSKLILYASCGTEAVGLGTDVW